MTYKVIRMYQGDHPTETIETGLTLEEAQAHCSDPETSSSTATTAEASERTDKFGAWFDGYEDEDRNPAEDAAWADRAREAMTKVEALIGSGDEYRSTAPGTDTPADGEHRKAASR